MKTKMNRHYLSLFNALLIFFFLLFLTAELKANDINVKNVRLTGQVNDSHTLVNFDLNWKNSWRNTTNYDAAWLFVKYKVGSGEWQHATLSTTGHTAPTGSTITPSSDGKGVFIYRSADGTGENNFNNISLRWNYPTDLVANDAQVTVKVFAIEMVYIPQGSFYVGDSVSTKRFYSVGDTLSTFQITSENALIIDGTTAGTLWATANMQSGTGQIPAEFPKGYNAFYLMKYEVTQEQYAEFLNMLTSTQAGNRFDPIAMSGNRFTITGAYPVFTTNRPTRACNYLAYIDGAAYADWTALRPITEFELEKACRGTAAVVAGEYAWGNTNIDLNGELSGPENGTETFLSGLNVNHGPGVNLSSGDGGTGPVRVGIFATPITNRETSGGSFYGVMEMSGNVWETVVTAGLTDGRNFQGTPGDGLLSSNGNANNSDWPGYSISEITSNTGSGGRLGGWDGFQYHLRVSDRFFVNSGALREKGNGFRCGRTAE